MARIVCPNCGSHAIITSRENNSKHVATLYVSCKNSRECGATFTVTQSFSHYLNPPMQTTKQLAASLLRHLPREEQLELLG